MKKEERKERIKYVCSIIDNEVSERKLKDILLPEYRIEIKLITNNDKLYLECFPEKKHIHIPEKLLNIEKITNYLDTINLNKIKECDNIKWIDKWIDFINQSKEEIKNKNAIIEIDLLLNYLINRKKEIV